MPPQPMVEIPHRATGFHRHHATDRIKISNRLQVSGQHHHALEGNALAVVAGPGPRTVRGT